MPGSRRSGLSDNLCGSLLYSLAAIQSLLAPESSLIDNRLPPATRPDRAVSESYLKASSLRLNRPVGKCAILDERTQLHVFSSS